MGTMARGEVWVYVRLLKGFSFCLPQ